MFLREENNGEFEGSASTGGSDSGILASSDKTHSSVQPDLLLFKSQGLSDPFSFAIAMTLAETPTIRDAAIGTP
jgi:hypothetical protein